MTIEELVTRHDERIDGLIRGQKDLLDMVKEVREYLIPEVKKISTLEQKVAALEVIKNKLAGGWAVVLILGGVVTALLLKIVDRYWR